MAEEHILLKQAQTLKQSFKVLYESLEQSLFSYHHPILTLRLRGQRTIEQIIIHQPDQDLTQALQMALQNCLDQYQAQQNQMLLQIDHNLKEQV